MGLKFQREDSLDKMLEEFAILPDESDDKAKKHEKDIERFLNPQPKEIKQEDEKINTLTIRSKKINYRNKS